MGDIVENAMGEPVPKPDGQEREGCASWFQFGDEERCIGLGVSAENLCLWGVPVLQGKKAIDTCPGLGDIGRQYLWANLFCSLTAEGKKAIDTCPGLGDIGRQYLWANLFCSLMAERRKGGLLFWIGGVGREYLWGNLFRSLMVKRKKGGRLFCAKGTRSSVLNNETS